MQGVHLLDGHADWPGPVQVRQDMGGQLPEGSADLDGLYVLGGNDSAHEHSDGAPAELQPVPPSLGFRV